MAEEEGFAVVFPQGLASIARWDIGLASPDVVMVGELLDRLEADLCIDRNRIFAVAFDRRLHDVDVGLRLPRSHRLLRSRRRDPAAPSAHAPVPACEPAG